MIIGICTEFVKGIDIIQEVNGEINLEIKFSDHNIQTVLDNIDVISNILELYNKSKLSDIKDIPVRVIVEVEVTENNEVSDLYVIAMGDLIEDNWISLETEELFEFEEYIDKLKLEEEVEFVVLV